MVRFGRSMATLSGLRDDESIEHEAPLVEQAVAFSLWDTRDGVVLAAETLRHVDEPDGVLGEGRREGVVDVTADFAPALTSLLVLAGMSDDASLEKVFGARFQCLSDGDWRAPIASRLSLAVEQARGKPMTNGLYVVVRADCSGLVEDLLRTSDPAFGDLEHAQQTGITHGWRALSLAGEPADPDARSAIRDDARVVVMNLESMSVHHDYGGRVAAGIVVAALPVVSSRARADSDHLALIAMLSQGRSSAVEAPGVLLSLRREHLLRGCLAGGPGSKSRTHGPSRRHWRTRCCRSTTTVSPGARSSSGSPGSSRRRRSSIVTSASAGCSRC
ncbi:hypothetical protein [Cellulomonas timonensis]|uniref:hypothetical protein n=1 Tax=Cellulomonas timonensis TaxID=1689271 RepID=UPI00082B73E1|nr:hypothetical protein [Cellulomonas timonensis]